MSVQVGAPIHSSMQFQIKTLVRFKEML